MPQSRMKILHASSELHPFSKTGGLADMVDGLAKALAARGHQVGVLTPLYRGVRERFPELMPLDLPIPIPLGVASVSVQIQVLEPAPNFTVYLLDTPEFYDRAGLYHENGADYPDNAARFTLLSKCAVHLARHLPWQPELLHVHDWQTGLAPLFVRHQQKADGWANPPRTVLSVHNLAFQGLFPPRDYALTNLPWDYFKSEQLEFYGQMGCLKAGLVFSDFVTTVSPGYAREITTPEFGCGLDGVLRQREAGDTLTGILNGVDYHEWKTVGNPRLEYSFTAQRLQGKSQQKRALQKEFGLPVRSDVPLFGVISRLSEQKGIDIELAALEEMLASPMQFVLLGSGATKFEQACTELAARHPEKVGVRIGFDQNLSHRIEAGVDFFLMPSRFEPSGLNQLYSLRYGAVPIVRATGGLGDSITDITEDIATANGIKFTEYSAAALAKAIRKALVLFAHPDLLRHYRRNGMVADFSWERASRKYEQVYETLLASPTAGQ